MITVKEKLILPVLLLLLLFGAFIGGDTTVQAAGFGTPKEALEQALTDYMSIVGDEGLWELGEIFTDGSFAYSIAKHQTLSGVEEGNILILARQQQDNLWAARAPERDTPEDFNSWLAEVPDTLLSEFDKSYFYLYTSTDISYLNSRASALHKFPWPIRKTARLTQKDGSSHTNQLDFVILTTGDVYASKPGVVIFKKESSNVGGCDISLWQYANLVVVQHSDVEYSWYFHLTQNSVTVEVGDLIGYGTKIGQQGNTGFACGSTGIHLHYMVTTSVPSAWPNPESVGVAPWPPAGSIMPVDFGESTWKNLVVGNVYESLNAPPPGICATGVTSVSLYDGTYCSNALGQLTAAGLYQLDTLKYEDKLESIEIPSGWSIGLYGDKNELGPKLCLDQTDEMLWNNNFDDGAVAANRASWMRVYATAGCPLDISKAVKLYATNDYGGDPTWGMVGEQTTDAPSHVVNSIEVPEGYSVLIWDEDGSGGNQLCLNASVPNLSAVGWGGNPVESLRLVQGDVCGPVDLIAPTVTVTFPEEGGSVIWPRTYIMAEGYDESGINLMHFFGWYDDGSGVGFDWYYLGADNDESDGWSFVMDLTPLAEPLLSVWVYAEDYAANFGSALVSSITVSRSFTFGEGFESRGGETGGGELENRVPTEFPSISDIPGMTLPVESTTESKEDNTQETTEEKGNQAETPAEGSTPASPEPPQNTEQINELTKLKINAPSEGLVFWGETTPELCWEPLSQKVSYFVRVEGNGNVIKSGWMDGSCWKAKEATGQAGSYVWKVKYQDKKGNVSKWTKAEFSIKNDVTEPAVEIVDAAFMAIGEKAENKIALSIQSQDSESGIKTVYVLAWYDDGGGADWHELKVVELPGSVLDLEVSSPVEAEKVGKLWVYVEDRAGNFGSDSIFGRDIQQRTSFEDPSGPLPKRLYDTSFLLKN